MWYCEVCKKDIIVNTKSSHFKSEKKLEKIFLLE